MFRLEIKTGGAAFRDESKVDKNGEYELDSFGDEVRRILDEVSRKLRCGYGSGVVMDINGNKVGWWHYE
jgi:hypothetical protein